MGVSIISIIFALQGVALRPLSLGIGIKRGGMPSRLQGLSRA
jgi:hypothetical protein